MFERQLFEREDFFMNRLPTDDIWLLPSNQIPTQGEFIGLKGLLGSTATQEPASCNRDSGTIPGDGKMVYMGQIFSIICS